MTISFAYSELNPYVVPPVLSQVIDAEAWRWTIQPLVQTVDDYKRSYHCAIAMWLLVPIVAVIMACNYKNDMDRTLKYHGEKQCREGNWKFYDERPVFRWENGYLYVDIEMVTATNVIVAQAVPVDGFAGGGVMMGGGGIMMGGGVFIG